MPLQYERYARLSHPESHSDGISAVTFSPDGQLLASGGLDGRICIWKVRSGKLLYVVLGKSPVLCLLWTDACEHLVCGMKDGTIATLEISEGYMKLDGFWAHRYPVERLAFNDTHLASGAHKEVKIWTSAASNGSWTLAANLNAPRRSSYNTACDIIVSGLFWTASPTYPSVLLVTYMNHGIAAFDARTYKRIGGTSVPGRIADASLTTDGILAVSNMLTGFELFAVKGFVEIEPMSSFKQDVSSGHPLPVQFLHGDHALIGGTSHGQVYLWDIRSHRKQVLILGRRELSLAVAAHYDAAFDDFFIATGIFNYGAASPIILWKTKDIHNRWGFTETTNPPLHSFGRNIFHQLLSACVWCFGFVLIMSAALYVVDVYHGIS